MSKLTKRKKIILLVNLLVFGIIAYVALTSPKQKRKMASVDVIDDRTSEILNSTNISWQETENGLIFRISDSEGKLCDKWNSLDIVFRAEGIAYSGEVDRVVQTTQCEEGKFQQTWQPNLTEVEGDTYQKSGIFSEEPPQWVMEQMILDGAAGTQVLSLEEIRQQYGSIPVLNPK